MCDGKALPSLEVLVLKDRDMASGRLATDHDREVYLKNNPPNHRVLTRREIENYLFDKEIVEAYCRESELEFDASLYEKFVTDIMNQDVKSQVHIIKKVCGIATSINPECFKVALASFVTPNTAVYAELKRCIFER